MADGAQYEKRQQANGDWEVMEAVLPSNVRTPLQPAEPAAPR